MGVVIGLVLSALVLAKAATFLRAGANATYWTRRSSPIVNGVLTLFIVLALVSQLVNPRAEFAYFTAFAGLLLGNLFQVKAASEQNLRPVPRTLVVGMAVFAIAAVGATVWTVQAIPDASGVLVNTLVLSSIFLWLCTFLATIQLHTEHWAPRRARRTL